MDPRLAFEAAGLVPPSILDVWRKSERKVLEAKSLARRGDDDDEDDVDEGEEGDEAAAAEKPKACAWAHKMPPKFPGGESRKFGGCKVVSVGRQRWRTDAAAEGARRE